jgi:membrane-bound lytic murein transglycosylase A
MSSGRAARASAFAPALAALALTLVFGGCAPQALGPDIISRVQPSPPPADLSRPSLHGAPPPAAEPLPASPGPAPVAILRPLSSLPGWVSEDHLAALRAFQAGCGVSRDPQWKAVCSRARAITPADSSTARRFFEANFSAEGPSPTGLLTAYFAPEFPAQDMPDEMFCAPVRPRPSDPDAYAGRPRAAIETDPAEGVRAFMKPEDLFYLQIQGSGVLVFPDGHRMKAIYTGDNGLPFTAIARPMLQAGLLGADRLSGDAIRDWLADHRGDEADSVMDKDQRYIFFDLVADDGQDPAGAAGTPLPAGRALAVDPTYHRYGALYWIDAGAPTLNGAVPAYRRLALALDTGAAIRGERRADLYLGRGDAAGHEAGRVRHVLSLVRLIPVPPPPEPAINPPHETNAPAGGV